MRPIELKMMAFGPYVNKQYLNFEENIADSNLFLIHGATGSGKTTILDAILFALYGSRNIGNGRDGKMMRSKHANSDDSTEVDFTFALGEKLYRVKRTISPDLQKVSSELYNLNDNREVITKNVSEQIENLIGFGSEQFRQVILLQQGEFKKFLFAKTNDRQKILDMLFDASFYKKVEERLSDKEKMLKNELKNIIAQHDNKLRDENVEEEEGLEELIKTTSKELNNSKILMQELDIVRKTAQDELVKGRSLYQKFKDLEEMVNRLTAAEKALRQTKLDLKIATTEYEKQKSLESDRKQLEKDIEEFVKIQDRIIQLQKTKKDFKIADDKSKITAKEIEKLNKTVTAYENRLEEILNETKSYSQVLANFEKYDAKVKECEARDKLLKDIEFLNKQIESARKNSIAIEDKISKQQKNLERLKLLSIQGRAALLAKDLKEGEPCPVCGSTFHPKLAVSEELIPTDEEIQREESECDKLIKQKMAADNKITEYQSRLQTQQESLNQKGDIGETSQWIDKREEAKQLKIKFVEAEKNFKKGKQLLKGVKDNLKIKEEEYKNIADTVSKLFGMINERENQIPEQYKADYGRDKLEDELKVSSRKLNTMNEAWTKAQNDYHHLEKQISAKNSTFETIKETHSKLAEQLKDETKPDILSLQKKSVESESEYTAQTKKVLELNAKSERLEKVKQTVEDLNKKIEQHTKDYQIWSKLSKVANGDNAQRIKFQTYILMAAFQDIIVEANKRLYIMSNGRYEFRDKIPDKIARNKFYGLDFEIYDDFTNKTRPVETLSGGESFLASLSLALGLADVVQSNSGGIKLDTIFIDEGFGSLDSDTLDITIRALNDLQKDGRLVGIISHVEELKQQIQTKLEVVKGKNGSFARFSNQ